MIAQMAGRVVLSEPPHDPLANALVNHPKGVSRMTWNFDRGGNVKFAQPKTKKSKKATGTKPKPLAAPKKMGSRLKGKIPC